MRRIPKVWRTAVSIIEEPALRAVRGSVVWLLSLLFGLFSSVSYASGPASEGWKTIETTHFRLHYHRSVAPMAAEVAEMCEAAHAVLQPEFEYTPRMKTEVVLIDASESANGSAGVFPRPVITLYAVPPQSVDTRTDSDHWMWELILHEYAHILHIDQIYGWIRVLNFPLGRQFMPNQILPRWILEGTATALESRHTGGGRVRSHLYGMYLRAALLDGTVPTLAQLSNTPPAYPYANFWYLAGAEFITYIGDTYGWDTLFQAYREQARRLRPWAINYMALHAIGATFDELYEEWIKAAYNEAYQLDARIVAAGVVEPERITHGAYSSQWAAATPQGASPHWIRADGKDDAALVDQSDPDSRRRPVRSSGSFSIFPDGKDAVISRSTRVKDGYFRNDLWLVDLASGRMERLTRGLRASQPAVSPDGSAIAYVRPDQGRFDLYIFELGDRSARRVVRAVDWGTIAQPSWTPDGRHILYSMAGVRSGRDLYAVNVRSGKTTRLTEDRAIEDSPRVSPNGRWLYYSSDRDGVFNIYARDLRAKNACTPSSCASPTVAADRRVTRVRTGVFAPVVVRDGARCALWMSVFSSRGYDIATLPLEDDCGPAAHIGHAQQSYQRPDLPIPEHEDDVTVGAPRRYRTGLLAQPWNWSPIYQELGVHRQFGFSTSGGDPAGRFHWRTDVSLGDPFNQVRWAVDLKLNMTTPGFYLSSTRSVNRRAMLLNSRATPYDQLITTVGGGTSYGFGGVRASQQIGASFTWEQRSFWEDVPMHHDPGGLMPILPEMGNFSNIYLSWSISNLRSFVRSVSPERGWSASIGVRVRTQLISSDYETRELSASLLKAIPIHRWERHALVLRLRGATSQARFDRRSNYVVGGMSDQNVWEALREQIGASTTAIRGFRPGTARGPHYVMLHAEYRFPLLWLDWGYSTLPLFFERVHGAFFLDAGSAFEHRPDARNTLVGMGAELRLDLTAGYYLPQSFRLGFARGFGPHGIWQGYLLFGGSF